MQALQPIMPLQDVEKTVANRTRALREANGAGKSTLINILSRPYAATTGDIIWRADGVPAHPAGADPVHS